MIVPPCVVTICCGVDVNLLALLAGVEAAAREAGFTQPQQKLGRDGSAAQPRHC